MSHSLQPHELQHARPPCSSPTPRVHPNSCPLSGWCHPAISSSVVPFSSCPQSLPASESFGSHQKKIPCVHRLRRSPNKMVGGVQLHLKSNLRPAGDAWRVQTKPCVHPGPRERSSDPAFECLLRRHRLAVTCGGDRGSGCSRPGRRGVWPKSSWRRSPLAHHRAAEQMIHRLQNNYIKEVLALLQKFWGPQQIT